MIFLHAAIDYAIEMEVKESLRAAIPEAAPAPKPEPQETASDKKGTLSKHQDAENHREESQVRFSFRR